jgi:hypothetical protein
VANVLELRTDGLGEFTFGDPMTTVFPGLVELLGEPMTDDRMHGDLPLGFGGEDSTARVVDFGGLRVVFGDWPTPYRDDRVMHVLAWGAGARRSENGTRLVSSDGVVVGATVSDLEAEFDPGLELPPDWCGGPVWYFEAHTAGGAQLIGSLAAHPYSEPGTPWSSAISEVRVDWFAAGEPPEDWGGVGFTC